MTRIVIDGRWRRASGIGRYVENLVREVVRLDTKNHYTLLVAPGETEDWGVHAKRVSFVETDIVWYTPQEQIALPKLLDSLKPDLVHFLNFNIPLRYRKPFVVTVHDLTMLRFKNIRGGLVAPFTYRLKDVVMRHVLKTAVTRSKIIYTPSQYVADDIAKLYRINAEKMIVTYNAADNFKLKGKIDLKNYHIQRPFLLTVGNAYPNKNLERLLYAMQLLVQKPEFGRQLVFVGKEDIFTDRLKALSHKLKLDDHVRFTGFIDDVELAGLYQQAEAYVFPSLSEGFGIPGLEAMRYGVPVISSNATCLPEIYNDAAAYFDPTNTDDMAETIRKVVNNKQQLRKLRELGYQQVKHFTWEQSAKHLLDGYRRALDSTSI